MRKLSNLMMILAVLMMINITKPAMAQDNPVKICVNGTFIHMDTDPVMDSGSVFVPIRFISEALGFEVEYLEGTKTVNIINEDRNIAITIGSTKAKVDSNEIILEVKPIIKDGRTFVPLRFISEGFGEEVIWDRKNQIVLIGTYKGEAKIEDTFMYTNEEYGYTLNFPNSWKEEAIIETKDGVLYVFDRKSAEKFISDEVENFGPVFEIRYSDYPVSATVPYDTNYILHYENGNYIEVIFVLDFQYYPETKDSYVKIWNEGQGAMASFKKLDMRLLDKGNYKNEIEVLKDMLNNYVPKDIFKNDEIYTLSKPDPNYNLLYLKNMKNEEELSLKVEVLFNNDKQLVQYHLKSYSYELKENKITQDDALKLANDFIKRYVDENIKLIKTPDLHSSLYEEDRHETYGDKDWKYVVVVDLEHGLVEFFSKLN